jgi:hypothetical protein
VTERRQDRLGSAGSNFDTVKAGRLAVRENGQCLRPITLVLPSRQPEACAYSNTQPTTIFPHHNQNQNWVFAVTTKEARPHDCVGENIPHAFETIVALAYRTRLLLFSSPYIDSQESIIFHPDSLLHTDQSDSRTQLVYGTIPFWVLSFYRPFPLPHAAKSHHVLLLLCEPAGR